MIYLDSALIDEAQEAIAMGWVKGITTNPTLLTKSPFTPEVTLSKLAQISTGELYYQLTATDFNSMVIEGKKAYEIIGEKTVLKVPATLCGFQVVAHLSPLINCSVTGIYSPAQAVIASEAGAKYAIAYVNRATRFLGDGLALVRGMKEVLKDSSTQILAASLKSPEEAYQAIIAGADHLTIPLSLLKEMTTHELSLQTVTEFNQNGIGLNY